MKKLVVFAVLAAIVASCADDNLPQIEKAVSWYRHDF